jgi:hypothetical protein
MLSAKRIVPAAATKVGAATTAAVVPARNAPREDLENVPASLREIALLGREGLTPAVPKNTSVGEKPSSAELAVRSHACLKTPRK